MNDFYAQLERQLVDAGRRRAERGRWRLALAGRARPLLALAAVLLAGVVAAASISALGAGSSSSAPGGGGGGPPAPPDANRPTVTATPSREHAPLPARPLRGTIVALYNGTVTAGLARAAAERLEAQGATIGAVGSSADQQQARTVVGYRPGAGEPARIVATILGTREIRPLTDAETVLPTRADVVVQIGSDRAAP